MFLCFSDFITTIESDNKFNERTQVWRSIDHFKSCSHNCILSVWTKWVSTQSFFSFSACFYPLRLFASFASLLSRDRHFLISYQFIRTGPKTFKLKLFFRTVINPAQYRVFAGATVLTNDVSPDHHRIVEKITIHPNYAITNPFVNDIAVITVSNSVLNWYFLIRRHLGLYLCRARHWSGVTGKY